MSSNNLILAMAYSQSKKLTSSEKKLQALKTQLYGKEQPVVSSPSQSSTTFNYNSTQVNIATNQTIETSFLKQDLLKIGILATVIFTIQALLFLGINRGLVNF